MAAPLYRRHSAALNVTYLDVENHALSQGMALVGTPGGVSQRENAQGAKFYVRQYYDHDRTRRDQYIAAAASEDAEKVVAEWKRRIEEADDLRSSVRLLAREGYSVLSPKHLAALAPLSNHGVFEAGAVLVGTHAFEVIVNRLGVRASTFATEDIDLARPGKLALEKLPKGGLLEVLRESGIDFVDVPAINRRDPSTSFKEKGRSRFTFDLLVPAAGAEIEIRPVPELKAHATALPYLRYLIARTQTGAALSNQGVASVRVPLPERFALHKLIVAQIREGRSDKSAKDLKQAAVLIAALGELQPGALEEAHASLPTSTRKHVRKSLSMIRGSLAAHPQSWEAVAPFAG